VLIHQVMNRREGANPLPNNVIQGILGVEGAWLSNLDRSLGLKRVLTPIIYKVEGKNLQMEDLLLDLTLVTILCAE
jgi:hypothetical protein